LTSHRLSGDGRGPKRVSAIMGLVVLAAAVVGFLVGRATGTDEGGRDAKRPTSSERNRIESAARASGSRIGYRRGLRAGRIQGRRVERRRAARKAGAAGASAAPAERPASRPSPQLQVNPNCPAGTEPTRTGGCAPYDESNGQIEPKINDPRCYSDRPPAGCF
jgi:hypothetical protein